MSRDDYPSGTDTAVLYALSDLNQPSTGSDIYNLIARKSSAKFSRVAVHKSLERMYDRDLVTQEERLKEYRNSASRNVRYYQITDNGYQALLASHRLHDELRPVSFTERVRAALRGVPISFGGVK